MVSFRYGVALRLHVVYCRVMSKAEYLEMAVKAGNVASAQRAAGQPTDKMMAAVRRYNRLAAKAV